MSDPQNPRPPFSPPPPPGVPPQGFPPPHSQPPPQGFAPNSGLPPQQGFGHPPGYAYPQSFPPPPAKKGVPVWGWVLLGLTALLFIGMAAMSLLAYLFVKKAEDVVRSPVTAVVRMAVAANPDLELLDVNETTGKVTVRDKTTGKVVTIDGDAIRDGKITIGTEEGSAVIGTGSNVKVPAWVVLPSDATIAGGVTGGSSSSDGGTVLFTTSQSVGQLKAFFEEKYKGAGFEASVSTVARDDDEKAMQLIFKHAARNRDVSIHVTDTGGGSSGTITFGENK